MEMLEDDVSWNEKLKNHTQQVEIISKIIGLGLV